jgi:hypothetical protein
VVLSGAVNVATHHPKLHAFPTGLADPRWPLGDGAAVARVHSEGLEKTTLFDASYDLSTYPPAREYCATKLESTLRRDASSASISALSRRCTSAIAPRGYGIDTHRVREALYLRNVPIDRLDRASRPGTPTRSRRRGTDLAPSRCARGRDRRAPSAHALGAAVAHG